MTTLAEMVQDVEDIIQDTDITTLAADKINAGLKDVAGRVLIPGLETVAEIDTTAGVNYVALPDNFQRTLGRWAYSNTTNRMITVYPSLPQLYKVVSKLDLAGNVFGIARQGLNLFYQRVPAAAQTLKIQYFKLPTTLSASADEPDCLPVHLHSDLLVSYACWKYWEKIEQGMDGKKPNTTMYKGLYDEAVGSLQAFTGPFADTPIEIVDELNLDSLTNY